MKNDDFALGVLIGALAVAALYLKNELDNSQREKMALGELYEMALIHGAKYPDLEEGEEK